MPRPGAAPASGCRTPARHASVVGAPGPDRGGPRTPLRSRSPGARSGGGRHQRARRDASPWPGWRSTAPATSSRPRRWPSSSPSEPACRGASTGGCHGCSATVEAASAGGSREHRAAGVVARAPAGVVVGASAGVVVGASAGVGAWPSPRRPTLRRRAVAAVGPMLLALWAVAAVASMLVALRAVTPSRSMSPAPSSARSDQRSEGVGPVSGTPAGPAAEPRAEWVQPRTIRVGLESPSKLMPTRGLAGRPVDQEAAKAPPRSTPPGTSRSRRPSGGDDEWPMARLGRCSTASAPSPPGARLVGRAGAQAPQPFQKFWWMLLAMVGVSVAVYVVSRRRVPARGQRQREHRGMERRAAGRAKSKTSGPARSGRPDPRGTGAAGATRPARPRTDHKRLTTVPRSGRRIRPGASTIRAAALAVRSDAGSRCIARAIAAATIGAEKEVPLHVAKPVKRSGPGRPDRLSRRRRSLWKRRSSDRRPVRRPAPKARSW